VKRKEKDKEMNDGKMELGMFLEEHYEEFAHFMGENGYDEGEVEEIIEGLKEESLEEIED